MPTRGCRFPTSTRSLRSRCCSSASPRRTTPRPTSPPRIRPARQRRRRRPRRAPGDRVAHAGAGGAARRGGMAAPPRRPAPPARGRGAPRPHPGDAGGRGGRSRGPGLGGRRRRRGCRRPPRRRGRSPTTPPPGCRSPTPTRSRRSPAWHPPRTARPPATGAGAGSPPPCAARGRSSSCCSCAPRRSRSCAPGSDSGAPAAAGVAPFEVTVDLDGTVTTVRTTARTAAVLGRELGVGKLVAVRDAPDRLRAGSSVVLRTRRSGQLTVDGTTLSFDSPSRTVSELLGAYNVSLEGDDTSTPAPDAVLNDGERVHGDQGRRRDHADRGSDPVRHRRAGRSHDPDRRDARDPARQGRHHDRHLARPPRERRRGRPDRALEGAVGRARSARSSATAPRPTGTGTRSRTASRAASGDTVDPAGSEGYDGGLGIYQANWVYYGGLEFAPNAGYATREEQIIVGAADP